MKTSSILDTTKCTKYYKRSQNKNLPATNTKITIPSKRTVGKSTYKKQQLYKIYITTDGS